MSLRLIGRTIWPLLSAGILLSVAPVHAAPQHFEKHFPVKGHPVVFLHNIGNGRIEVKSSKNPKSSSPEPRASNKVTFETEQAGDRIDVTSEHRRRLRAGHGNWKSIFSSPFRKRPNSS